MELVIIDRIGRKICHWDVIKRYRKSYHIRNTQYIYTYIHSYHNNGGWLNKDKINTKVRRKVYLLVFNNLRMLNSALMFSGKYTMCIIIYEQVHGLLFWYTSSHKRDNALCLFDKSSCKLWLWNVNRVCKFDHLIEYALIKSNFLI